MGNFTKIVTLTSNIEVSSKIAFIYWSITICFNLVAFLGTLPSSDLVETNFLHYSDAGVQNLLLHLTPHALTVIFLSNYFNLTYLIDDVEKRHIFGKNIPLSNILAYLRF